MTLRYGDTFGSRLTYVLTCEGIKQSELANKLGMTRQSVSLYVKDEQLPSLSVAIEIAKILDVSLDWLCCLED